MKNLNSPFCVFFGVLNSYKKSTNNENIITFKQDIFLYVLSLMGLFIAGISSGYYILVSVLVALLFYSFFEVFYKNTIKGYFSKDNIYILLSILTTLFAKFFNSHFLHFRVIDSNMKMISLEGFFGNLQSIVLGYFELLVGLPHFANIRIMEKKGVYYLVGTAIALFLILILIKVFIENIKKQTDSLLFIFLLSVNIFVYSFTNSKYGAQFFEIRYLVLPVLFLFCLIPFFLQSINDNLLVKKTIIFCMIRQYVVPASLQKRGFSIIMLNLKNKQKRHYLNTKQEALQ